MKGIFMISIMTQYSVLFNVIAENTRREIIKCLWAFEQKVHIYMANKHHDYHASIKHV